MRYGEIVIASTSEFIAGCFSVLLGENVFRYALVSYSAGELERRMKAAVPRLVFIEHYLAGACTAETVFNMAKKYRNTHIAVWSVADINPHNAARFILAGAESFFSLREKKTELAAHVRQIMTGKAVCPAAVADAVREADCVPDFDSDATKKEAEIIRHTAKGKKTDEIALLMGVTVNTVKKHRANMYQKCEGNTVVDLLRYGFQRGVICGEDF